MKRFTPRHLVIALSFLTLFAISVATFAQSDSKSSDQPQQRTDVYHDLEIFTKILEKVSQNYVVEVDTHKLMKKAIDGMLSDLDPHSQYLDGLEYEDLMVSTRGEFGGLGMLISFRDNYPTVMSPIDGTPASRAGIRGGDQIIEIEGQSTAGWTVDKAVGMLRGDPGTKVKFRIRHPGQNDATEYALVREIINVSSVPYHGMLKDGVGYIRVSNFAQKTAPEMEDALEELEGKGMRALVLDFRANPGGLLQTATEVSELFLEKDKLIVYTKGRLASSNRKYYSSNKNIHTGYPIVVMINGSSASASEIFTGAMQDWDAAFVVGQTSYGKGTVQTVFKLSDTEAVKLTTAKYYTPSGRSIHKDENDHPHEDNQVAMNDGGGDVDDSAPDAPEQKSDAKTNELKGVKDAKEKPVYYTSSGRVVYGGGGITPDLEFTPREYTDLQRRLERDYLGFSFALDYLKSHTVTEDFKTTDAVLKDFYKFMDAKKFEYKKEDLTDENVDYIRTMIAREIVNAKFGRNAMYKVVVDSDPEVNEVLQILDKHPTLKSLFAYGEEEKGAVKKAEKSDKTDKSDAKSVQKN
ncbi:MAG TPA: S41 family peptidase [Candidatus Krumholzibacteria bacterium]|nr:S41 family peptidase [Candidatus Krumholzibacteria bacterium]